MVYKNNSGMKNFNFILIIFFLNSCSTSGNPNESINYIDVNKFRSNGYIEFIDDFVGCNLGDKVYIKNGISNFFECRENIPSFDSEKVTLLTKDHRGTSIWIAILQGSKYAFQKMADNDFAGKETMFLNWSPPLTPPFTFIDCDLNKYTSHKIVEPGSRKTYLISFQNDLDIECIFEDSNGVKFLNTDIIKESIN